MPDNHSWIPLFPLNTVLFPGGVLPLKVFETRYLDMLRECMKKQQQFGVVLIKSGQEVGIAAEPESIGCLTQITEWDMQDLGVMMLRTVGGQRFRIMQQRVLPDQRLEAQIELIPADQPGTPDQAHLQCASTLKLVIDDINNKGRAAHGPNYASPFALPLQFDNAGWVANRWCEILPIPLKARQALLELNDGSERLDIVHQYLLQHNII
ncbi:ATP-dependent protease La domain protein [Collimonas arenae]|uniref:ATP-dependent protease La domain protein n=1 Tax=Collimonas arenae TaxID=279058 RepID=A0A127PL57_9BURK|nr:LON peptidase substrate-binding domain-containing protein [Collimonas arenae]AMO98520.1 ATP-dependent protease La domain protein [Collimonas arenae]AMP08406.1 ATP-dependent protease La domain protein [Collimonas arenae]